MARPRKKGKVYWYDHYTNGGTPPVYDYCITKESKTIAHRKWREKNREKYRNYKREYVKKYRADGKDSEYNRRLEREKLMWTNIKTGFQSWWP